MTRTVPELAGCWCHPCTLFCWPTACPFSAPLRPGMIQVFPPRGGPSVVEGVAAALAAVSDMQISRHTADVRAETAAARRTGLGTGERGTRHDECEPCVSADADGFASRCLHDVLGPPWIIGIVRPLQTYSNPSCSGSQTPRGTERAIAHITCADELEETEDRRLTNQPLRQRSGSRPAIQEGHVQIGVIDDIASAVCLRRVACARVGM